MPCHDEQDRREGEEHPIADAMNCGSCVAQQARDGLLDGPDRVVAKSRAACASPSQLSTGASCRGSAAVLRNRSVP